MDRRRFLALAGASVGALAGCTDAQNDGRGTPTDAGPSPSPTDPPPLDGSWASYQHDAANTGATDDPGPVDEPVGRWRHATTTGRPTTAPAVADGAFVVGTETGVLYARDAGDGSVRWSRSLPAPPAVAPVAAGDTVVVAADETLFGLAADTGAERWTATVGRAMRGLAVGDDRVVVATGDGVRAFALGDGSGQWRRETDATVVTPPAVGDGVLAVGLQSGDALALEAGTGEPRWRSSVGAEPAVAPAVAGGTVYAPAGSRLVALDADTGDQQWDYDADATVATSPVVTGDAVYLDSIEVNVEPAPPTPGPDDETPTPKPTDVMYFGTAVVALSPDGGQRWRVSLTEEYNFTSGAPTQLPLVLADGLLVVGLGGTLRAFDAATGDERWSARGVGGRPAATAGVVSTGVAGVDVGDGSVAWRFQTSENVSPPVVVGNTVYAGSDDNYLYALAANTGTIRWTARTDGPVRAAPAVGDDAVYVGTQDGTLHAFDRADGTERWQFDVGGQVQSPALYDGTVYVGNFSPAVTAVDAADGTERWHTRVERDRGQGFVALALAVADGTVYTGANGDFRAFDAATGDERWRVTRGEEAVIQTPPAVGDDHVFLNIDHSLRAFDTADGTERWSRRTGWTNQPPVVDDGRVYAPGDDAVYAFDAADGTERWQTTVGGDFMLAAGADAVYGLGFDTPVFALDPDDGSRRWQHGDTRLITPPAVADDFLFVGDDAGRIHGFAPESS